MTVTEWSNTLQHMALWGPGLVILWGAWRLLTMVLAILKTPPEFVGQFIQTQQAQAVSMAKMAEAITQHTARDGAFESELSRKMDMLLVNDQVIMRRLESRGD